MQRISTRNSRFQVWQASLTNRSKRQRAGEFLVQGVRPITLAVEHGWHVRTLLRADRRLSDWALDIAARLTEAEQITMAPELLAELAEKEEAEPELVAVVETPPDDLARIPVGPSFLGVVFDRPTGPGNIGSIVRSADAFGADGVVVTGHAADPYDPKAIRATTGSLFGIPVVRAPSHREVVERMRSAGVPVVLAGTDENGTADVWDVDLTGPTLLLVGNETRGLSAAWREAADVLVRIPMAGSASSLNAANAATAVLYEAARQRAASPRSAG